MTAPCEQTEAVLAMYVDGELDAAEADAFSLHLASCAACRAGLHDSLQLVAVEARASAERPAVGEPVASHDVAREARTIDVVKEARAIDDVVASRPSSAAPSEIERARARRSRTRIVVAVVAVAAALAVVLAWPRGAAPREVLALATAPVRSLEGRVSYAAADRHRIYAVARAGTPATAADPVPLETLARLEQRGDRHGVAVGYLLRGDAARAVSYLNGPGPDVAADLALTLLLGGHPDDALIALDGVLAAQPRHPQALWNRALALRDLGLTAAAAAAFDAVAALDEPGWAAEARLRAQRLRAETDQRRARFDQLVAATKQLTTTPTAIPAELARQIPGTTRVAFDGALRGARGPDAARALAPLAAVLDGVAGDTVASDAVERVARADWARRELLAVRYARLAAGDAVPPIIAQALRDELRGAHQDDLRFAVLIELSAGERSLPPEDLVVLQQIAEASHDPWLAMIAIEEQIRALLAGADPAAAAPPAERALASCPSKLDLVCSRIALLLGKGYFAMHRPDDARRVLADGLARARRGDEWRIESDLLGQLVRAHGDPGSPRFSVGRAYLDELQRRIARPH